MSRPRIAVTCGDPCGVGPEVILKAFARLPAACRGAQFLLLGPRAVFESTAKRLGLRVPACLVPTEASGSFHPGRTGRAAGRAAIEALERAVQLWREGTVQGLVTAPVTKWAVALAEPGFVGHTEWLAKQARASHVVMAFVSPTLRVALLTRHLPLAQVARAITRRGLIRTVQAVDQALRGRGGLARPRIAVCGVNPHAGEAGQLGGEERRVMAPAIAALRRAGVRCDGPLAADGLFADTSRYDIVVCAYHDQGLIPFKMAARDEGCQVTFGLPFVRTSPDHGSALDIAGQGIAHPGSMRYALASAARLVR